MDIFFYTSIYEGLPNAVLEAMACGLPIVASNIREISEITPPELGGQLFAPKNVKVFVAEVKKLCTNIAVRETIGIKGRQWVKRKFGIEASARKLMQVLITGN